LGSLRHCSPGSYSIHPSGIADMPWNYGTGTNNSGDAVGNTFDSTFPERADWIWDGWHDSLLTVPASTGSMYGCFATRINDWDAVFGWHQHSEEMFHGFLKKGGTVDMLDARGVTGTQAYAVNDLGDDTGFYWTLGPAIGFVWYLNENICTWYGFVATPIRDGEN